LFPAALPASGVAGDVRDVPRLFVEQLRCLDHDRERSREQYTRPVPVSSKVSRSHPSGWLQDKAKYRAQVASDCDLDLPFNDGTQLRLWVTRSVGNARLCFLCNIKTGKNQEFAAFAKSEGEIMPERAPVSQAPTLPQPASTV
jgi:hypothetical protein